MQRRGPGLARPIGPIAAAVVAATVLVACASTATSSPSAVAPTDSAAPGSPSPVLTLLPTEAGTSPAPTQPGQTATAWGRIWDALPSSFPAYPGAHPTETGGGPASATLDAGTARAAEVIAFYRTPFTSAGYTVISSDGPREDGSIELIVGDQGACAIRVTAGPLGGSTIITIMYGALCPFT